MAEHRTTEEMEQGLGEQIRQERLRQDITIDHVANHAGVSRNAVRRLETGAGATVGTMVSVLQVLDRLDWLNALRPAITISPMAMLKTPNGRQRASKAKSTKSTLSK